MAKNPRMALTLIVAIAVVGAGGGAYLVITSADSASPCAGVALGLPTNNSTSPSVATQGGASGVPAAPASPASAATVPEVPVSGVSPNVASPPFSPSNPVQVVAAENFWGSLVAQMGGNLTHVVSIITDPNTDPHEYEANATTSVEIADANYVIVNGVGYDQWAIDEVAADRTAGQVVLNVGILNGVNVTGGIVTGNPHMWYNPHYVYDTVAAMYQDLVSIAPANITYFQAQYAAMNASLATLYAQANEIQKYHDGAVVASTESIFVYLANYTGLDLISPPAFMEAIAEGNDPPTQSVVTFECQLESGKVAMLVYNIQTVTPITTEMKAIAAANNVTYTYVSETIQPPGDSFQQWMGGEFSNLQDALNASELGS